MIYDVFCICHAFVSIGTRHSSHWIGVQIRAAAKDRLTSISNVPFSPTSSWSILTKLSMSRQYLVGRICVVPWSPFDLFTDAEASLDSMAGMVREMCVEKVEKVWARGMEVGGVEGAKWAAVGVVSFLLLGSSLQRWHSSLLRRSLAVMGFAS